MRVNANYTWLKCLDCGNITKMLPGQKFETLDEVKKIFGCSCKQESVKKEGQKPKKAVSNAA